MVSEELKNPSKEVSSSLRIAIMSPWNDACGIAVHAWLVGTAWLRAGHEIVVFASVNERPYGRKPLDVPDEEFVYRCWELYRYGDRIENISSLNLYFNPEPFLKEDFDVIFIEKPCSTPLDKLIEILPHLRRKGPIVAVMHEGIVPKTKDFYNITWELATIFDERFYRLYGHFIKAKEVEIVPYPYHTIKKGSKKAARSDLKLPIDKDIILTLGIRAKYLWELMPYLDKIARERDLILLILSKHKESINHAMQLKNRYNFVCVRREAPSYERLYKYLHASDVLLVHRPSQVNYIPVSSTVHLCLGAMRPILCADSTFFAPYNRFIVKYHGPEDFLNKLNLLLDDRVFVKNVLKSAERVIAKNSADRVAQILLKLAFEEYQQLQLELLRCF